jgi:hypothetical protein
MSDERDALVQFHVVPSGTMLLFGGRMTRGRSLFIDMSGRSGVQVAANSLLADVELMS